MMISQIQNLLTEFLSRNHGPGYGISVTSVTDDLSQIDATVTFLSGRSYCCAEPFCHVPADLAAFLRFVSDLGVGLPPKLQIHWHFVVEQGALLECHRTLGASPVAKRHEYDVMSAVRPAG